MPRKAKTTQGAKSQETKNLVPPKSYVSLIYGIVTVVILIVLIVLGIRAISQNRGEVTDEAQNVAQEDGRYTVKQGESLWTIAENELDDGFRWTEIAELNQITEPFAIETGQKLDLPSVEEATEEVEEELAMESEVGEEEVAEDATESAVIDNGEKLTGNEYTVVKGDYLWDIALRAYGDGFRWVDIARANALDNPDIIHPGNVLTLPR